MVKFNIGRYKVTSSKNQVNSKMAKDPILCDTESKFQIPLTDDPAGCSYHNAREEQETSLKKNNK